MTTSTSHKPKVRASDPGKITEARKLRLGNGIPVYMIESGSEDISRIEFSFDAGNIRESLPLLSSTVNLMLSEGSQKHTAVMLNRMLDHFGVFYHSYAERDRAGLIIICMNRNIEKVLELIAEILFLPVFPERELNAIMKKRLNRYLIGREQVNNLATDQFFESIFGSMHPYGRQIVAEDFKNLKRNLLIDFHDRYYSYNSMAIFISGKLRDNTAGLLERNFGKLHFQNIKKIERKDPLKKVKPGKIHINKPGSVQTAIRVGSSTINKRDPDYPGLKILNVILGGYFGSRLMKNIREDKGFTYGISSVVTSLDLSGYKYISAEVSKIFTQKAIDEIYREIQVLQKEPVGKNELKTVRNYMLGEMVRMFDGPFALAESFRSAWEFGLDNSYYYRLTQKIKTIQPDEIISLAKTYYNLDDLHEVTAG
jgi:zinc protease